METIKFSKLSNFFDKQWDFLEATKNYKYVLYGGTVGSGKSYALRWIALYWLLRWGLEGKEKVSAGIFCRSYFELEDRHLKYVRKEFPNWLGDFFEQKHEFHLKEEYGGGILSFRNLDEPEKYYSSEFALIAIDEITQIPLEVFEILNTRLRWPGIENTKFIAATNPIGELMLWVRQFFIEKNLKPELNEQIFYVKALPTDNPYLPESYFENLKTLPEAERKALLEGDWYAFEGIMNEEGYIPLITPKELENSFIEENEYLFKNSNNVLGIDVGAGGDKTAIVLRNQLGAKILFNEKLSDTMQILPLISRFISQYKIMAICLDVIGVGKGVYDRLTEIGFNNVYPVVLGQKAENKEFFNKRAALYWKLREWLLTGGKLIKNEAFNQILLLKYKRQSDKVIRLISKDDLRKQGYSSPDVADALALTFEIDIKNLTSLSEIFEQELMF